MRDMFHITAAFLVLIGFLFGYVFSKAIAYDDLGPEWIAALSSLGLLATALIAGNEWKKERQQKHKDSLHKFVLNELHKAKSRRRAVFRFPEIVNSSDEFKDFFMKIPHLLDYAKERRDEFYIDIDKHDFYKSWGKSVFENSAEREKFNSILDKLDELDTDNSASISGLQITLENFAAMYQAFLGSSKKDMSVDDYLEKHLDEDSFKLYQQKTRQYESLTKGMPHPKWNGIFDEQVKFVTGQILPFLCDKKISADAASQEAKLSVSEYTFMSKDYFVRFSHKYDKKIADVEKEIDEVFGR